MLTEGLNPVAFPVTVRQNAPNVWQPFNWDLIKEVRKTVMANGLSAPFSQALLENIFSGQILTGFDCTQLATMILTPTQHLLWKVKWAELCDLAALRNLDRPEGDPRYMITTAQMMGTGDFADVNRQARLPVEALQESASLALKAMLTLPEAGKPQQSFTSIRQGNTEPYMSFIDHLRDAIEKQIDNADAKEALIIKLAMENANADCKKILQSMPGRATLVDMIEACNKVGSLEHKTTLMANAFAVAMRMDTKNVKKCYKCGQPGHLQFQCKEGRNKVEVGPNICPRCHKGRHYANQCRSRFTNEGVALPPRGTPSPGNYKKSARSGAMTPTAPKGSQNGAKKDVWQNCQPEQLEVPEWMSQQ
ncbi:endogenous retrovirus group K member 5 Gag polyprotein-like [Morphnus guianensis]